MRPTTQYRLWLKLRVGKRLETEESTLTGLIVGRTLTIKGDKDQPLSNASWLIMSCGGFGTETEARAFGDELRRAAHMAGVCSRVGVDAGDPGEDRTSSRINPDVLNFAPLGGKPRLGPDVHGVVVLPDDGKSLFVRLGGASGEARANAAAFVRALEEAWPGTDADPHSDAASVRRSVRLLNLAEMNKDPVRKVVQAVAAVEGLASTKRWSKQQREFVKSAAAWLEQTQVVTESVKAVAGAIRGLQGESIGKSIRRLLSANGLSDLQKQWDDLYTERGRLVHNDGGGDGENLDPRLGASELHALGQRAIALCSRIVLSIAKRGGVPVPSQAKLHFDVE